MKKLIITLTFAAATVIYANAQTPAKKENNKANATQAQANTAKPVAVKDVTESSESKSDKKGCSSEEKKACGTEEKSAKKACCSSKKAENTPNP